ncbi:mitochondrial transcription factor A [Cotesia typhae]|uniref:mitochondrial transcription factor A n=1 Tax=Cotesia typhae TaxID=2053667 RepID=UPI003D6959BA
MASNKLLNFCSTKIFSLPRNFLVISRDYSGSKRRLMEQRLDIPERPKRPLNAFLRYTALIRDELKEKFPEAKVPELCRLYGKKWAQCDPALKKELQDQYRKDMLKYSHQVMDYERKLTDEQKMVIEEENRRVEANKKKNELKARLLELGKPKKPPTAFILYMMSHVKSKDPDTAVPDWMAEISKEWTKLPAEKREKFEIEAKKLMEQYKNDMIDWEAKMIQMGNLDVIRRQVLLDLKDKTGQEEKKR